MHRSCARVDRRPQCSMIARLCVALVAVTAAYAQPPSQWVETSENQSYPVSSPDLQDSLDEAKMDALLLYTEYSARIREEYKHFLGNLSTLNDEVFQVVAKFGSYNEDPCRIGLEQKLKKFKFQAHKAALFSAENHHKYVKGHMIVFRMHLNKSEDFLKKCDRAVASCRGTCSSTPRISRWRKHANDEIKRFRDDIVFSRRFCRDILTHARKDLLHIRKLADRRSSNAVEIYQTCRKGS